MKCARFRCGISRYYEYHPDGSRRVVERSDRLNGAHVEGYAYDPVSGRLASVQDVWTGETNGFAWNPEGTLARWEEPNSYARVFGYDEEGRLVKISGITVLVACSWRMSTGTVAMARVCGSGIC